MRFDSGVKGEKSGIDRAERSPGSKAEKGSKQASTILSSSSLMPHKKVGTCCDIGEVHSTLDQKVVSSGRESSQK